MTARRLAAFVVVGHAAAYVVGTVVAHGIVAVGRAIERVSA